MKIRAENPTHKYGVKEVKLARFQRHEVLLLSKIRKVVTLERALFYDDVRTEPHTDDHLINLFLIWFLKCFLFSESIQGGLSSRFEEA